MVKSSMFTVLRIGISGCFGLVLDKLGFGWQTPQFWIAMVLFCVYGLINYLDGVNK